MFKLYNTSQPKISLSRNAYSTRGNSMKLESEKKQILVRSGFFTKRIVNTWNSLPEQVVKAPSVNAFKNRLDRFWRDDPGLYAPDCFSLQPCPQPRHMLQPWTDEQTDLWSLQHRTLQVQVQKKSNWKTQNSLKLFPIFRPLWPSSGTFI